MSNTKRGRSVRVRAALGIALLVGGAVGGTACSTESRQRSRPLHDEERLEPWQGATPRVRPVNKLVIFDGRTGTKLAWDEVMALARAADAVLVGEVHGNEQGGAVEVALFKGVLETGGMGWDSGALSLEFFDRDEQVDLDDYLTGVTQEKEFLHRTGRKEGKDGMSGNYPPAHRDMVEMAKAAHRPVIASNAPRRYVAMAREDGLDRLRELMPEQRALFVIPDALTAGAYRERFFEDMAGMMAQHVPQIEHKEPGEGDDSEAEAKQRNQDEAVHAMIEKYYVAQNVWDATMADSVAMALSHGMRPVVHVVGQFHVDDDGGLVQRLREARPGAQLLTVSLAPQDAPVSGEIRDTDMGRADVVVYLGEPE